MISFNHNYQNKYNKMIFVHGVVHCDPHAGNLLVRPHPRRPGQPQVVLLDHGLYRDLDDAFRLAYCRLWKALVLRDLDAIRRECNQLGAQGMPELFAAIVSARTWDQIALHQGATRLHVVDMDAHKALVRDNARAYADEISAILSACPRDLLLILKCNDCLRTITGALGSSEETWPRIARAAVRGMHHPAGSGSWAAWAAMAWDEQSFAAINFVNACLSFNAKIINFERVKYTNLDRVVVLIRSIVQNVCRDHT